MPLQFTAQNIASIGSIRFETSDGELTAITCDIEVNYGDRGMFHSINLWDELNIGEQHEFKTIYDLIKRKLEKIVLE